MERRYGIGAMEMTSEEILSALSGINEERLLAKLRATLRLPIW